MGGQGSVALDRDLKAPAVQRIDQRVIDLQHRFPAGEDDIAALLPLAPDPRGKVRKRGGVITAAILAIHADEIGIAKAADRARTILLAPGPQIASGKAQKHGATPGTHPFALKGEEHLLYRVAHA